MSPECGAVCPKGAACDFECYDPTIMRVYQTQYAQHGQNQLNYVSWRPNFPRPQNYLFDDSAGEDINVYIVDNGANLDHPVSFDLRPPSHNDEFLIDIIIRSSTWSEAELNGWSFLSPTVPCLSIPTPME